MRGAPLDLAIVAGHFVEVYVVDDDRSYHGADLIGQQVYRRDLRTGDSALVYTDSLVPALARAYGRAHPHDSPLTPEEDPDDNPELRATATLDLGAATGAFIAFELHTDVERAGSPLWHTSRRGTINLRTNREATLADIVGNGALAVERQRDAAFQSVAESVLATHDKRGQRAAAALAHYRLEPTGFEITTEAGSPAIAYSASGSGPGDSGHVLELAPISIPAPAWWNDIAPSLPTSSADGRRDVWKHGAYSVVVRYDATGAAHLAIRDSTSREWPIGPVSAPATHVFWLDAATFDAASRTALTRAFNDAARYGVEAHVAAHLAPPVHLTRLNQ